MRKSLRWIVAALVVAGAGCSSGDPMNIEFSLQPTGYRALQFQASGVAVDEAAVCDSGTLTIDREESSEGEVITEESGSAMVARAQAEEGVFGWYSVQEFVCDDGSGTFTIKTYSETDFGKPEAEQPIPTWEIDNGAGAYAGLSGSGEANVWAGDPPGNEIIYSGEVQNR